jgi:hypothetical protein
MQTFAILLTICSAGMTVCGVVEFFLPKHGYDLVPLISGPLFIVGGIGSLCRKRG